MIASNQKMNAKKAAGHEDKQWENPVDPEKPVDERDAEKSARQYKEAKRRKRNLTSTDHVDKKKIIED